MVTMDWVFLLSLGSEQMEATPLSSTEQDRLVLPWPGSSHTLVSAFATIRHGYVFNKFDFIDLCFEIFNRLGGHWPNALGV